MNVNVKTPNISKEHYAVSNICFIFLITIKEFSIYGYLSKTK